MKFPKSVLALAAAVREGTRFAMAHVLFRPSPTEEGKVEVLATTGTILARHVVPAEGHLEAFLLPATLLRKVSKTLSRGTEKVNKRPGRSGFTVNVTLGARTEDRTGAVVDLTGDSETTPVSCFPPMDEVTPLLVPHPEAHTVRLNAALLADLAKAIGRDGEVVTLHVGPSPDTAVVVTGIEGADGCIMPVNA
jgi:hypothetical protein